MFTKKPVRLLKEPTMRRCSCCQEYRFAIAVQTVVYPSARKIGLRWICQSCGQKQGLHPTQEYLRNLRDIDKEDVDQNTFDLTLQDYLKTKPKVNRIFHRYGHSERMTRAGSHRLGHQERDAVGHYIYTIQGVSGVCFRSPSQARRAAHLKAVENALKQKQQVPGRVLQDYPWLQNPATNF